MKLWAPSCDQRKTKFSDGDSSRCWLCQPGWNEVELSECMNVMTFRTSRTVQPRHPATQARTRTPGFSVRFLSVLIVGLCTLVAASAVTPIGHLAHAAQNGVAYDSPADAYEAGRRAFKRGDFRSALKPLRDASKGGVFLAKYYLAEILSDRRHIFANAEEAYALYSDIIDLNPDVDPQYDYRAKFVARAYVMKGRYLSGVLPIAGQELSQSRARRLFGHAATYLDDPDAQFEFARMLLQGRGGAKNVRSGKHYLSTLSRKGHAAAQGYLAELFWDGELVRKRDDYALALSTMAVRNTPREDQIWLGELHHEISCAASAQVHEDADRLLKRWEATLQVGALNTRRQDDVFSGSGVRWSCERAAPAVEPDEPATVASGEAQAKELWTDQTRLEALHGSLFGGFSDATDDTRRDDEPVLKAPLD